MKNDAGTENFGPSQYDFEFDFEFRFTAFDYILMGVYGLFVFPFILLTTLVSGSFRKYKDSKKDHSTKMEFVAPFDSESAIASYCPWPRVSER